LQSVFGVISPPPPPKKKKLDPNAYD